MGIFDNFRAINSTAIPTKEVPKYAGMPLEEYEKLFSTNQNYYNAADSSLDLMQEVAQKAKVLPIHSQVYKDLNQEVKGTIEKYRKGNLYDDYTAITKSAKKVANKIAPYVNEYQNAAAWRKTLQDDKLKLDQRLQDALYDETMQEYNARGGMKVNEYGVPVEGTSFSGKDPAKGIDRIDRVIKAVQMVHPESYKHVRGGVDGNFYHYTKEGGWTRIKDTVLKEATETAYKLDPEWRAYDEQEARLKAHLDTKTVSAAAALGELAKVDDKDVKKLLGDLKANPNSKELNRKLVAAYKGHRTDKHLNDLLNNTYKFAETKAFKDVVDIEDSTPTGLAKTPESTVTLETPSPLNKVISEKSFEEIEGKLKNLAGSVSSDNADYKIASKYFEFDGTGKPIFNPASNSFKLKAGVTDKAIDASITDAAKRYAAAKNEYDVLEGRRKHILGRAVVDQFGDKYGHEEDAFDNFQKAKRLEQVAIINKELPDKLTAFTETRLPNRQTKKVSSIVTKEQLTTMIADGTAKPISASQGVFGTGQFTKGGAIKYQLPDGRIVELNNDKVATKLTDIQRSSIEQNIEFDKQVRTNYRKISSNLHTQAVSAPFPVHNKQAESDVKQEISSNHGNNVTIMVNNEVLGETEKNKIDYSKIELGKVYKAKGKVIQSFTAPDPKDPSVSRTYTYEIPSNSNSLQYYSNLFKGLKNDSEFKASLEQTSTSISSMTPGETKQFGDYEVHFINESGPTKGQYEINKLVKNPDGSYAIDPKTNKYKTEPVIVDKVPVRHSNYNYIGNHVDRLNASGKKK